MWCQDVISFFLFNHIRHCIYYCILGFHIQNMLLNFCLLLYKFVYLYSFPRVYNSILYNYWSSLNCQLNCSNRILFHWCQPTQLMYSGLLHRYPCHFLEKFRKQNYSQKLHRTMLIQILLPLWQLVYPRVLHPFLMTYKDFLHSHYLCYGPYLDIRLNTFIIFVRVRCCKK